MPPTQLERTLWQLENDQNHKYEQENGHKETEIESSVREEEKEEEKEVKKEEEEETCMWVVDEAE